MMNEFLRQNYFNILLKINTSIYLTLVIEIEGKKIVDMIFELLQFIGNEYLLFFKINLKLNKKI